MTPVSESGVQPEPEGRTLEDANLLVSVLWRAPGQARKEIVRHLRALGDGSPVVMPTGRRGLTAVRTSLDPRAVVRRLQELAATEPQRFRTTCKWVPVDLWTADDLDAMRRGVAQLQTRIAPGERWRMTLEKRTEETMPAASLIAALAELVPARVDLGHPDKILLVQLFPGRAAMSALAPSDVLSIVPVPWLARWRRGATARRVAGTTWSGFPAMPESLDQLAASLGDLPPASVRRLADVASDPGRPFHETVDLALELLGGVVPQWPVLADWNHWCVRSGARFFVWAPSRGELPERSRAEALVHTVMMLSAKERAIREYLVSGVREAEVAMAGDDCVVCDQHRHVRVPLGDAAGTALPPFHPGCRCGFRPHLG